MRGTLRPQRAWSASLSGVDEAVAGPYVCGVGWGLLWSIKLRAVVSQGQ